MPAFEDPDPAFARLTLLEVRYGPPVLQLEVWDRRPKDNGHRYSWTATLLPGESTVVMAKDGGGLVTQAPDGAAVVDIAGKGHALACFLEDTSDEDDPIDQELVRLASELLDALPECMKEWDGLTFG
ncbi:hypothetical protein LCGC14_2627190 [marine sediment metagenome]|uniref:Uncharacterized protein n=1 Tax=marine sediment metagenome TaxID=412755 RepID=A0A0F9A1H0_9ZZZZ